MMIVSNRMGKITCKLNESLVMIMLLYIQVIKMKKKSMFYFFILKWSHDFLLCTKKETNCVLFIR